jgi:hypothetical protein
MKRTNDRGRLWTLVLLLILACLYYLLTVRRSVKLLDEQEVPTERTTLGLFWLVIEDEGFMVRFGEEYKVRLPENDFNKHNLLVSDGRRILKLKYRLISKYQWHYRFLRGEEEFDHVHYPHSMFVYKIKKIYLHRAND